MPRRGCCWQIWRPNYPDHPVVVHWRDRSNAAAAPLLAEARSAADAGQWTKAAELSAGSLPLARLARRPRTGPNHPPEVPRGGRGRGNRWPPTSCPAGSTIGPRGAPAACSTAR